MCHSLELPMLGLSQDTAQQWAAQMLARAPGQGLETSEPGPLQSGAHGHSPMDTQGGL
jgi:hypothetical protein